MAIEPKAMAIEPKVVTNADGVVTEAEGYTLHLSRKTETGYVGVFPTANGKFIARKGRSLGTYDTLLEAAVAYAKRAAEELNDTAEQKADGLVTEAEGYKLYLSQKDRTGYTGVYPTQAGKFVAQRSR